jgi:hypothetical protein
MSRAEKRRFGRGHRGVSKTNVFETVFAIRKN